MRGCQSPDQVWVEHVWAKMLQGADITAAGREIPRALARSLSPGSLLSLQLGLALPALCGDQEGSPAGAESLPHIASCVWFLGGKGNAVLTTDRVKTLGRGRMAEAHRDLLSE